MTLRHDATEFAVRRYPDLYEQVHCKACKKTFIRHKDAAVRSCSPECATKLNNSTWRYQNIPCEKKRQLEWGRTYKKRKRDKERKTKKKSDAE